MKKNRLISAMMNFCPPIIGECSFFLAKEEQIADIDKAIRKIEDKKSKLREL